MRIEVEITNGQNIIDIFFNDFASCLVVKKALAVNWPDCRGSVGEYYAISDYAIEERNFYTDTINNVLIEGSDSEQIKIIKDFLKLFANGKYSINKFIARTDEIDFLASNQVIYSEHVPHNERFFGRYYPYYKGDAEPTLFSITNDKIDESRVEYYCQLIKKGIKPTVVTFDVCNLLSSEYSCTYVLDGHHKIKAYLKLKENIPVIGILKLEESTNKTASLLHHAKTILKDFEYLHLFQNNDENLLSIDFVNDKALTRDLDQILKNSNKIAVSLINVLQKYSKIGNDLETSWFKNRLINLRNNNTIDTVGTNKVLTVYEKIKHEAFFGEGWGAKHLNSISQLEKWIDETLK